MHGTVTIPPEKLRYLMALLGPAELAGLFPPLTPGEQAQVEDVLRTTGVDDACIAPSRLRSVR